MLNLNKILRQLESIPNLEELCKFIRSNSCVSKPVQWSSYHDEIDKILKKFSNPQRIQLAEKLLEMNDPDVCQFLIFFMSKSKTLSDLIQDKNLGVKIKPLRNVLKSKLLNKVEIKQSIVKYGTKFLIAEAIKATEKLEKLDKDKREQKVLTRLKTKLKSLNK